MFEDCIYLVFRDTRKPLEKLGDTGTVLEVFKKGFDRNPCAAKDPGTTYFVGGAFYGGAGRPVEHGVSLALEYPSRSNSSLFGKLGANG
jgi:hypothetical protein